MRFHGDMLWLWISLPVMLLAIGIAVGPLAWWSVQEHRRVVDRAFASGDIAVPDDRRVRVALEPAPWATTAALRAVLGGTRHRGEPPAFPGMRVVFTDRRRQLVVTVPAPRAVARRDLEAVVARRLTTSGVLERVEVLSPAATPDVPPAARPGPGRRPGRRAA